MDESHFRAVQSEQSDLKPVADFLFEVGMLRRTPRTGYQFLGSGQENVAEHCYRTSVIGYVLASLSGCDWARVVQMCLFHDLHEARTGDFNYVNRMYNTSDVQAATQDCLGQTGLQGQILDALEELEQSRSPEAVLAQDADQLDLILSLKEEQDLGNPYAPKWLHYALKRLRSELGVRLAEVICATDHTDWWFKAADSSWWARGNGQK
jgi:putative hydrolase of HD superfamily